MAQHNLLGKRGEQLAVNFLLEKGYTILRRNYRFDRAEVDIIAQHGDTLVAVEVKTRSSTDFGDPQDFLTSKQIRRLVKAVDHYVVSLLLDVDVRFDIIAVVKEDRDGFRIRHFEDAFSPF